MQELPPFHLAIWVRDLEEARRFYGELLGCAEGRSSDRWVDFNFFGHQVVCHLATGSGVGSAASALVDSDAVPVPHFGAVLEFPKFEELAAKLKGLHVQFIIEPHIRFKGQSGEQATMFLRDPSGNPIEFKAFRNIQEQLFAK